MCRKMMCYSELRVKALLIYLHLLGEHLEGVADGPKKEGGKRELSDRVSEGGEDTTPSPLRVCLSGR